MLDLSWQERASCKGIPTDFFYTSRESGNPKQLEYLSALRRVCSECPVLSECADYGIKHEKYGFFGGLTESERRAIRGKQGIPLQRPEYMTLGKQWS